MGENKMNIKLERINSDIYKIVAEFIMSRGINTEITDVKTTADLSECKVFVTAEIEAIEKAGGHLRTEVARRMSIKNTPKFKFILDKGRDNASRVEELLQQIKQGQNG